MTDLRVRVEIVPYDPGWPDAFAAERDRLRAVLGRAAVRIDHHGSTAVAGLDAKPVLDIQVSVRSLRPLSDYVAALARIGYIHKPHPDDTWCPYFRRPLEWPHTHHVHLVEVGGEPELRTLAFRDVLRERPDLRRDYAQLKYDLARQVAVGELPDRDAYAAAKTGFVTSVTDAARAAGHPRPAIELPLETERLALREFVSTDFEAIHEFASDPEVTRHMFHGPRSEPDTRDYLDRVIRAQSARPRRTWEMAVVERSSSRLIGACDLTLDDERVGDLGYILRRDKAGRGYATEAAGALVDAGFAQLRLERIYASCEVGHLASARVLAKVGLRWVATVEHEREARGRWWNMERFEVHRREWLE